MRIALQQALPFKIAADTLCDALRQFGEFGARGCVDPAEAKRTGGVFDVHPIEKQHVKVQIEIECAAKALNQGDRAGAGRAPMHARLVSKSSCRGGRWASVAAGGGASCASDTGKNSHCDWSSVLHQCRMSTVR